MWRSDDFTKWGLFDNNETWKAKRPVSFVLKGRGCEPWTARCLGHASSRLREKAVGLGTDDGGFGIRREVIENTSGEWFECDLDRADGRRWQVRLASTEPSGFGGVLLDERQSVVARVHQTDRQTGKPYTYAVPSPVGFVIETGSGVMMAVERAFQGAVVLSHATPPDQVCPLATVAAALLLWKPLRW